MQKVSGACTKDNNPVGYIKNSDVMYVDEEKTTSLLHSVGFQHAYSVERSGYIGNISYDRDIVNIIGTPFSDVAVKI